MVEKTCANGENSSFVPQQQQQQKNKHTAKFCASIIISDVHLFVQRCWRLLRPIRRAHTKQRMMKNISIESDQIKLHLVHSFQNDLNERIELKTHFTNEQQGSAMFNLFCVISIDEPARKYAGLSLSILCMCYRITFSLV